MELLFNYKFNLQGMTPLHYAMSRGHQNATLLLVHAGCELESQDNDQNTPLHLAAQNGHEGCVKALIYYAEHSEKPINISRGNSKSDTPLHMSSRWGYVGIVTILTEHGAAINVSNARHSTPGDCAHDIHILRILQRSLRRRSLVQTNHGDYVNIEMMKREECGGVVMLISEPTEVQATTENGNDGHLDETKLTFNPTRSTSRASSRGPSRRTSTTKAPFLAPPATPRSRKISTIHPPPKDINHRIAEDTEKCLLSVAEHLLSDASSPDFVQNYFDESYDPTEQDHLTKIEVESLQDDETLRDLEMKKGI